MAISPPIGFGQGNVDATLGGAFWRNAAQFS
jgi:hypothetical protein